MKLPLVACTTVIALLGIACSPDAPSIPNPTGTCPTPGNAVRAGYDGPSAQAVWLPDCQNPLAREYWRVYAQSAQSTHMIPRPDGSPNLVAACGNDGHPLHALVEKYLLCSAATNEADVARINAMSPADAFELARYLHSTLAFTVASQPGLGIEPFPIPGDIIDACALHPELNSADFAAICTREQERLRSGNTYGFSYEGPGAAELVARLNELYGIACAPGLIPVAACTCGPADGCAELSRACRPPCQVDGDCPDPALPMCSQGFCNQPCG